ncbi:maleylpyruvate isomerase N-terminal domain-containing protein [Streptomyces sp. NBC_01089]|uniref:maleylpyruvate isomerase N-terminal domain-containing protein n=1 Tax=Streptomyces sp. NBC_01089 TaxID=2903747 RepID=UPI003867FCE8|nr:maleylpyruvate isomerase family mycothiol-dependent enzyme [Streptomyces sp. NBC_01089]
MTTDAHAGFDPAAVLEQIDAATEHLVHTAARFTDADVRAPSLLPDWSRGHVLTHLARNADGGRRLLTWARTGVQALEYPSLTARDEEIENGAGRSADVLVADLRDSAAVPHQRCSAGAGDPRRGELTPRMADGAYLGP